MYGAPRSPSRSSCANAAALGVMSPPPPKPRSSPFATGHGPLCSAKSWIDCRRRERARVRHGVVAARRGAQRAARGGGSNLARELAQRAVPPLAAVRDDAHAEARGRAVDAHVDETVLDRRSRDGRHAARLRVGVRGRGAARRRRGLRERDREPPGLRLGEAHEEGARRRRAQRALGADAVDKAGEQLGRGARPLAAERAQRGEQRPPPFGAERGDRARAQRERLVAAGAEHSSAPLPPPRVFTRVALCASAEEVEVLCE